MSRFLLAGRMAWAMLLGLCMACGEQGQQTQAGKPSQQGKPNQPPAPLSIPTQAAAQVAKQAAVVAPLKQRVDMPVEIGPARVSVFSLAIDKVPLGADDNTKESAQEYLQVALVIENTSADQKIDYQGWGTAGHATPATLADDLKYSYPSIDFEADEVFGQHRKQASIAPGKSVLERLVFEVPTDQAKFLVVTLPLAALGLEGNAELVIQNPAIVVNGGSF